MSLAVRCGLVVAAAAALAIAPLFTLLCLGIAALLLPGPGARVLLVCSVCLLFVLLNLSKEIEGDLVTYESLQRYVAGQPFDMLLRTQEMSQVSGTYRLSELGFYGSMWALASVFGDSGVNLPVAATLGIYLPVVWGVTIWGRAAGWNMRLRMLVLLVFFFGGLNFVQTTHLMRQYLAGSFSFLAMTLLAARRGREALLAVVVACSMHNSAVLAAVGVGLSHWLFGAGLRWRDRPFQAMGRLGLATLIFGSLMVWLGYRDLSILGKDIGNLSVWHLAFAASLLAGYMYGVHLNPGDRRMEKLLIHCCSVLLVISAGYYVVGYKLLALRYFAYLEWLYALLIAGMLCAIPRRFAAPYLLSRLIAVGGATLVLILRLNGADWAYGPGRAGLLTADIGDVAEYINR